MKKIYILIFCISATFVSCKKKCYECPDRPNGTSVCDGDTDYDMVENGCCFQPIQTGTPQWVSTCQEND